MLEWRFYGTRWRVGVPFFAFLSLCLISDPTYVSALCLLASILHEGGHLLALCLLGTPPCEVSAGVCGIRIVPSDKPLGYRRRCVMLLAGPMVNLLCAAGLVLCQKSVAAILPHLVLGLFNLLPVEALDGGQCLKCVLLCHISTDRADKIVRWLSVAVLLLLFTPGFYLLIRFRNITLLAVCVYLTVRLFGYERI